jgi:peptidoglycan/LPS O-acetylase OafA/YrhL
MTSDVGSRQHVAALDGIRGVAILAVVAFHYWTMPHHHPVGHAVWTIARAGWLGVDVFFVLSGFLVTGILLDSRDSDHYFRNFYVRRTLRIFPLYYAVLALVFGVLAALPFMQTESFNALRERQQWLWAYAVNIANAGARELLFVSDRFEANHFWSLAAEQQFYAAWPAFVLVFPARRLVLVGLVIVLVSFVCKGWCGDEETYLMLLRADGLVLGGVAAAALRISEWRRSLVLSASVTLVAALGSLLLLMLWRGGLQHQDPWVGPVAPSLVVIGASALIVFAVNAKPGNQLIRLLAWRPLLLLGRYSYGLYVIHWAFAPLFDQFLAPHMTFETGARIVDIALLVTLKTGIALVLAVLSYHFFEQRFLVLKDRWAPTKS